MAKFYGAIGYATTVNARSGVWEEEIVERTYFGDLNRNMLKLQTDNQVIDNINIANEISIVADPFAYENFHAMRYVEYMGARWKITGIEEKFPRLILTVGGVYNGPTPSDG